jgi:hypothetical protein
MDFKKYFTLSSSEKNLIKPNSGTQQHQTVGRIMNSGLNRKRLNLVGKVHTNKEHHNTKITKCYNTKQDQKLTDYEAKEIMDFYNIKINDQEPKKAIKQLGVYLKYEKPHGYILTTKN